MDKRTGKETFVIQGASTGKTLHDFWAWAYSDIVNNTERGKLAEFIVASALDVTDKISPTWDSFDLASMGKGIEVKSAAYLQSWYQKKDSYIAFGTPHTTAWDATTGTYSKEQRRQADVYVFCLLAHKDKQTLNPLDLAQWEFYVIATSALNVLAPTLKRVSLSFLKKSGVSPAAIMKFVPKLSGLSPVMVRVKDKHYFDIYKKLRRNSNEECKMVNIVYDCNLHDV